MNKPVEFIFYVQEIPKRNLVGKFIDKIKTGLEKCGLVENKDYEFSVERNNLPIIQKEMMVGGATDSTFPYSIMEGLLDYIDNNVRVIKRENIKTDEYEKTVETGKRILDGLFTRIENRVEKVQDEEEKKPQLPNSWDNLFVDTSKKEDKPSENLTSGFLNGIFSSKGKEEENKIVEDVKEEQEEENKIVESGKEEQEEENKIVESGKEEQEEENKIVESGNEEGVSFLNEKEYNVKCKIKYNSKVEGSIKKVLR